jgi:hypothetical protein
VIEAFLVRLVAWWIGIVAALVAVIVRGRRASGRSPDRGPCGRRAPGTVAIGTTTVGATSVGNGTATITNGPAAVATGCPIPASTDAACPIAAGAYAAGTDGTATVASPHVCNVTRHC